MPAASGCYPDHVINNPTMGKRYPRAPLFRSHSEPHRIFSPISAKPQTSARQQYPHCTLYSHKYLRIL